MKRKPLPPQDYLLKRLRYEPETGKLYWRERAVEEFPSQRHALTWNTRYANQEAMCTEIKSSGYLQGYINNVPYIAHRTIFKMLHGTEPYEIDHDDHNRKNNRPNNLVAVTHEKNSQNQTPRKNNTSGCMGVSWQPHANKWKVKISNKHIGYANTFEEAVAMREQAMIDHNYHPNHGK